MFVQLVYFSRPGLLRKACSSGLRPYQHTNILQRGPELHLHANEEPQEETSLPGKGHGSRAAFVPAPARLRGLTGLAPRSRLAGPTSTVHGPPPDPRLPPALAPQPRFHCCPSPQVTRPAALAAPSSPTAGQAGLVFLLAQSSLDAGGLSKAHGRSGTRTRGPGARPALGGPVLTAIALRALTTWEVGPVPALSFKNAGI